MTMVSNVLANIRSLYPAMTPSGRNVADYVLAHGNEVIHMPITELAYRCSVSETSIMRFCRVAGMNGYQDFRLMLSSALASEECTMPEEAKNRDEDSRHIHKIYSRFHTIIQGTMEMLKPEKLKTIAKYFHEASQVYLFGSRDAMHVTANACQMLMRSLRKGRSVADGYSQSLLAETVSRGDLVFLLSVRADDQELYRLAERARHGQAKLVSISCCGPTPLDSLCSVSLYCGRNNPASTQEELVNESSLNLASMSLMMEMIRSFCMAHPAAETPDTPVFAPMTSLPQTYFPDH